MPKQPATDIIEMIREDHEIIKQGLTELPKSAGELRAAEFWALTQQLVRHEVAEEVVVFPALRQLPGGDAVADSCIAEQSEAERLLADMEDMDAGGQVFAGALQDLTAAVVAHAEHEERDVLTLLREAESSEHLVEMGARYSSAKEHAPTRPHPNAPNTPPGNRVVGPVAALFDRIRDAISSVV